MENKPPVIISPDSSFVYIAVRGSLHATDCSIFGMNAEETAAILARYPKNELYNAFSVKGNAINVINSLSELGYHVISSCGENETTWTLQREV
jgi:hypothetical protein